MPHSTDIETKHLLEIQLICVYALLCPDRVALLDLMSHVPALLDIQPVLPRAWGLKTHICSLPLIHLSQPLRSQLVSERLSLQLLNLTAVPKGSSTNPWVGVC
jgi:hypothetical protein